MSSPTVRKSPSLKSLSDSSMNIDMSDLEDNQQTHQETVKRFSILSGIQEQLNKKLEQKPALINSIIIEEDEENSIQKSKENQDWNIKKMSPRINAQNIQLKKHQPILENNLIKKQVSSNRYLNQNQNNNNLKQIHDQGFKKIAQQKLITSNPIVNKPYMYKVRRQINLLESPPQIIHHPRAFQKQQTQQSNQPELFTMALQTQRRKNPS